MPQVLPLQRWLWFMCSRPAYASTSVLFKPSALSGTLVENKKTNSIPSMTLWTLVKRAVRRLRHCWSPERPREAQRSPDSLMYFSRLRSSVYHMQKAWTRLCIKGRWEIYVTLATVAHGQSRVPWQKNCVHTYVIELLVYVHEYVYAYVYVHLYVYVYVYVYV